MKNTSELREQLGSVSSAMAKIHRLILENEIEALEIKQGAPIAAAGRLQLLLNSPDLAWLRALSQCMAAVDEIYFQKEEVTEEQARQSYQMVEKLLIEPGESEFFQIYRERISSVPDLMMQHGHLRLTMRKLQQALTGN